MRVDVIDPSAYTPPYDHALCAALAAAGAEVQLLTSRFPYGSIQAPLGYRRREIFYRRAHAAAASGARSRARLALKLAEHLPGMLRCRSIAATADIAHYQWLPLQQLDARLLPGRRRGVTRPKLVITAHDVLPREPRMGQTRGQRLLYRRFDAVVVHSRHGAQRLIELGVPAEKVHVIGHGAFAHLAHAHLVPPPLSFPSPPGSPSPPDFPSPPSPPAPRRPPAHLDPHSREPEGPIVLFFGLLRPYKGLDVLLDAWRRLGAQARAGAQLWIVGMPRMDLAQIGLAMAESQAAALAREGIHVVPRFVPDDELASYFARADLVVLPYREADQSGVLFTALAFGRPLLLSDVGGFPEIAETGAAVTVPAGDPDALAAALGRLLADPAARQAMSAAAQAAAAGPFSWQAVAKAHMRLYEQLLGRPLGENGAACAPLSKSSSGSPLG